MIEEVKKEYKEKFIEEGSFKVQGTFLEVWDFIEQKLTQQREEAVKEFVNRVKPLMNTVTDQETLEAIKLSYNRDEESIK